MKKNNYKLLSGLLAAVFLCVSIAAVSGQTSVTWARESAPYNPANEAFWNEATNWSPQVVPNNGGTTYNVTIQRNPASLEPVIGPRADINVVLDNLTIIDRGIVVVNAGLSLTVLGTTTVDAVPPGNGYAGYFQTEPGATITLGTLTSYDPGTQTQNFCGLIANDGIIKFHGANIVTSDALLYLIGPAAGLRNQDDDSDAIANLAVNNSLMICAAGYNFSSAGDFTNNTINGFLRVEAYALADTTFTVNGNLTNYNPATNTLSGGNYYLNGDGAIATLRFADADIRHINANLEMEGDSQITDLAGNNALSNLTGNSGTLQLSGNFTITPAGGTFSNTGTLAISSGASVTVDGDYSQTAGSTTVSNGGSLTTFGTMYCDASIIALGTTFGSPLVTTVSAGAGLTVTNFSQLTGTGTAFGDLTFTADSSWIPGFSAGQINVEGNVSMDSTTSFIMEIGGTIPGEEFDLIAQTGSTFSVDLGGSALVLSLINGFEASISNSDTFDIITSENPIAGSFGNVASGQRLITADGFGSFRVDYSGQNAVTLSDFLPPPQPTLLISRKMHGAVQGDLSLPLSGTPGVEPRSGGGAGIYQMIIGFPNNVVVSNATVTGGTGNVDTFGVNGGEVTVDLTGVANAQTIVVTLVGVDDGTNSGNVSVSMSVLIGDTTRNRAVNSSDISQVKAKSGTSVSTTNFIWDLNVNGEINSSDVSLAKSKSGTGLPPAAASNPATRAAGKSRAPRVSTMPR